MAGAVATAGTGVQLSSTSLLAPAITLQARRATSANVGDVWIEDSSGNILAYMEPGQFYTLPIAAGFVFDLSDYYVDGGTATDGVIITYWR